jgi:hypothetical protein
MSSAADYDLSNPFSKRRWSHNMTAVVLLQQHPGQTATTSLSSASRSANILVCNLILDWDKAPNLLQQQASAHDLEIASCICPSILEEKKKLDGLTQTATTTKAQNPHTHSLSLSLSDDKQAETWLVCYKSQLEITQEESEKKMHLSVVSSENCLKINLFSSFSNTCYLTVTRVFLFLFSLIFFLVLLSYGGEAIQEDWARFG